MVSLAVNGQKNDDDLAKRFLSDIRVSRLFCWDVLAQAPVLRYAHGMSAIENNEGFSAEQFWFTRRWRRQHECAEQFSSNLGLSFRVAYSQENTCRISCGGTGYE